VIGGMLVFSSKIGYHDEECYCDSSFTSELKLKAFLDLDENICSKQDWLFLLLVDKND